MTKIQTGAIKKYWWVAIAALAATVLATFLTTRFTSRATLAGALDNLTTTPRLHTEAQLQLNLPPRLRGRERPFTAVDIQIRGDVKRHDDGTPELTGTFYADARGRGNIFFADGEIRLLHDAVAFRLVNLPVLLNPSGNLVKKWTYVDVPTLTTANAADIKKTVAGVIAQFNYQGRETINNESLRHFSWQADPEQEQQLADLFRQSASGNRSLHVITRLLDAHNVKTLEVWVDQSSRELRRLRATFVRPLKDGQEFPFATLTLNFTDYGKSVNIDTPARQLNVSPSVFSRLFGTGEVAKIQE